MQRFTGTWFASARLLYRDGEGAVSRVQILEIGAN
jgi:hypothetical protein